MPLKPIVHAITTQVIRPALPLGVDGLILAASLVLLHEARNGRGAPALARLMLWLGIGTTVGANIAYGAGFGLLGALISAWPAVAFIGRGGDGDAARPALSQRAMAERFGPSRRRVGQLITQAAIQGNGHASGQHDGMRYEP